MTGVAQNPNTHLANMLNEHHQRITAIEHQQNFAVRDSNKNVRVAAGGLGSFFNQLSGDIGFAVADPHGNVAELNPPVDQCVTGGYSTTSETYVDLGFPSLSAYIGASGSAIIMASSLITTTAAGQGGLAALEVDGTVLTGSNGVLQAYAVSSALQLSVASMLVQPSLTPQTSHTFKLVFRSSVSGDTAMFSQNNLIVWPI